MLTDILSEIRVKEEKISLLEEEGFTYYLDFQNVDEIVEENVFNDFSDEEVKKMLLHFGFEQLVDIWDMDRLGEENRKKMWQMITDKKMYFETALMLHSRQGLQYLFMIEIKNKHKTMLYHSYYDLIGFTRESVEDIIENYCINKQEKVLQYKDRLNELYRKKEEIENAEGVVTA